VCWQGSVSEEVGAHRQVRLRAQRAEGILPLSLLLDTNELLEGRGQAQLALLHRNSTRVDHRGSTE